MAIAVTNLGISSGTTIGAPDFPSDADQTSYSNGSWTPPTADNCIILLWVWNTKATTVGVAGTVTGNGLTWTLQASNAVDPGAQTHRLSVYAAISTGTATAGATTVDYAGVTQSSIIMLFQQVTGVDLTGALAGAIIQQPSNTSSSANTLDVTLSAAGNSNNRFIAGIGHGANESATVEAGWDELDNLNRAGPGRQLHVFWDSAGVSDVTPSTSWTTAAAALAVAIEVVAATGGATNYDETVAVSKVVAVTDTPTMAWGTSVNLAAVKAVSDSPLLAFETTMTLAEILAMSLNASNLIADTVGMSKTVAMSASAISSLMASFDLSRVETIDASVLQALQTTVDLARIEAATFDPIQAMITAIGVDKVVSISIISAAVVVVTKGYVTILDFATSPVTVISFKANATSTADSSASGVETDDL